jgi:polysaccharide pyruvyl transferase WcaK-like protein
MKIDSARRKIVLFGVFGVGNLGNECTLTAMIYNIRRHLPDAEISCICSGPEEIESSYGISAVPIRETPFKVRPRENSGAIRLLRRVFIGIPSELYRWYKAAKTLKGSDMLVMTGTGMLGDFGILPFDLHYDILRWSIVARLCRCKLLFVSVGAGPIRNRLSRCFVKTALTFANYRSYRDTFSKQYLESVGFKTNSDAVYPDLAFSLPQATKPDLRGRDSQETVVGVGIMTYYNKLHSAGSDEGTYRDYIGKVAAFVMWLLEHQYIVRLIIGDAVYDGRVRQDLRKLLEMNGFKYDLRKIIDEPASSADEVLSQLAATDVVVASRFHNVLLALMLSKLVMAISYHEKVDALVTGVGLKEFSQDIEHIDVDKLVRQFMELERNAGTLKPQVERKTADYRKALDEQYDHIFNSV